MYTRDRLFTDNQSFGASTYLWDFGDETTSTEFEPEHEYKALRIQYYAGGFQRQRL